jgi:hypothetical protein
MMLAVMYGMMPSAKIVSWSSAPPDARGRKLRAEPEDHDDPQDEEQLATQVRRSERVHECA